MSSMSKCLNRNADEDGTKIGYRHPTSIFAQSVHLVHRLSANFDIFEWQSHVFQKVIYIGIKIYCKYL